MNFIKIYLVFIFSNFLISSACCQKDSTIEKKDNWFTGLTDKQIKKVDTHYKNINAAITKNTLKQLKRFEKLEAKLHDKLNSKDSLSANQLFNGNKEKYDVFIGKLKNPEVFLNSNLSEYIPKLDSLQSVFKFLGNADLKNNAVIANKLAAFHKVSTELTELQNQLHNATSLKDLLKQRNNLLKNEFEKYGLGKQYRKYNKQAYYYQEQLATYKAMVNDPDKLSEKVFVLIRKLPLFKIFMSKNSELARLFPVPANYGDPSAALNGLQSRMVIQGQISQQINSGGSNGLQYFQEQMQLAKGSLDKLKDKVLKTGGSQTDIILPDFRPNTQRSKSFWKRLEYGVNIQSQKSNGYLPTSTDFGASIGYKLNDKITAGTGAAYKQGWGKDISHIHLSGQGVSLRSFIDLKIKGSFWLTGGYEENYQSSFKNLQQLNNLSGWQQSGLLGLTKKYSIGKRKGNLQLFWDYLSYSQKPVTPALKFRICHVL